MASRICPKDPADRGEGHRPPTADHARLRAARLPGRVTMPIKADARPCGSFLGARNVAVAAGITIFEAAYQQTKSADSVGGPNISTP